MKYWQYHPKYLSVEQSQKLFQFCFDYLPFQQSEIQLFGKSLSIPRKECLVGEVNYGYSGNVIHSVPWPPLIQGLKRQIESDFDVKFNVCLVNFYADGMDSNGWHADDEPILGVNPTIVSVSLGATRKFQIRAKTKGSEIHSMELENGSLLLMKPGMQEQFKHQLPKQPKVRQPRINLTFRQVRT